MIQPSKTVMSPLNCRYQRLVELNGDPLRCKSWQMSPMQISWRRDQRADIDAIGARVRERLFQRYCCCSCARDTRGCGGVMVGHGLTLLAVARTHASDVRSRLEGRGTAPNMAIDARKSVFRGSNAFPLSYYPPGCWGCAVDTATTRV